MRAYRSWLPFLPVLCFVLFSTSCAGLFEGVRPGTPKDSLQYPRAPISSPSVVKYVNSLGQKLFRHADAAKAGVSNVNIAVLETSRIQGSSSIYSPRIEVTRGMLNVLRNEAELAALISHEIGHKVLHRDRKRPYGDSEVAKARWSQGQEREADEYGAVLAGKAGYDPYALTGLFDRLSRFQRHDIFTIMDEWTSTHKDFRNRSKDLGKYLAKNKISRGGVLGAKEYELALAPLRNIHTQDIVNEMIPGGARGAIGKLAALESEIRGFEKTREPMPLSRFIEIMDEISGVMAGLGLDPSEIPDQRLSRHVPARYKKPLFMKEVMSQDSPLWADEELQGKISDILASLGRIGVGFIPVVGDAVDLYEFLSGREFGTGRALDFSERVLTAGALLAGSGKMWRETASRIDKTLDGAKLARGMGRDVVKQARRSVKQAGEIVEIAQNGKIVVIGEDMKTRVIPYSKRINAKWYKAWKIKPFDETVAMRRNERWIKDKIKEGYQFIDIGPKGKQSQSDFYKMEKRILEEHGVSVIKIME